MQRAWTRITGHALDRLGRPDEALAGAIAANWMTSEQLGLTGGGAKLKLSAPKLVSVVKFRERDASGWGVEQCGQRHDIAPW